jgi:hypothetical protein
LRSIPSRRRKIIKSLSWHHRNGEEALANASGQGFPVWQMSGLCGIPAERSFAVSDHENCSTTPEICSPHGLKKSLALGA